MKQIQILFTAKTVRGFTCLLFFIALALQSKAQDEFIYTKEGYAILNSRQIINNCLKSLHKDKTDAVALTICECQTLKLNRKFTRKQYKEHTKKNIIDLTSLIKEDSVLEKEIQGCFGNSGTTVLFKAEGFQSDFIADCMKNIQSNTEKKLDTDRLKTFCVCQLNLIKQNKISDAELEALSNPNSLLFFEMMYKCGDPFAENEEAEKNWNENFTQDIQGPGNDTIKTLSLNGMTYIKLKIGSLVQVWLLDTGASDLLITNDMETQLKKENIITAQNYLGTGEYEMANGMIDTCRKYRIDNLQIGGYMVNNVVVAVSDKARRIIAGKGLLNKFSNWSLNNRSKQLILVK